MLRLLFLKRTLTEGEKNTRKDVVQYRKNNSPILICIISHNTYYKIQQTRACGLGRFVAFSFDMRVPFWWRYSYRPSFENRCLLLLVNKKRRI